MSWIEKLSMCVIELMKEISSFQKSVIVLVTLVWLVHIVKNVEISLFERLVVLDNVTAKWCIELLKSGPVVFQCVLEVMYDL
jgi:hypothetical protein